MREYFVVRTADKIDTYVKRGVSAIGWSKIDFTKYDNIDDLCNAIKHEYYINDSSRLTKRDLGQIRIFKSIKKGDVVLVPCYKAFYIGIAKGEFKYDKETSEYDLSNQIVLDYIKKNNEPLAYARDGKVAALVSKLRVPGFTVLSITEEAIKAEIERLIKAGADVSYQDRVIAKEVAMEEEFKKELQCVLADYEKNSLNSGGRGFEELIKIMMEKDGYNAKILDKAIGGSSKADADVLAVKESVLGEEFSSVYFIQAKHYQGDSDDGIDQIVEFKNEIEEIEKKKGPICVKGYYFRSERIKYMLISSGNFTDYVKNRANENGIILIDGNRLSEILFNIIEEIPEIRYKLGFAKTYEHI